MLKKVVIAVVVIAVIGAVGLFIADRTIFAPAQVTTRVPVAPSSSEPLAGSGTLYKIDPAQSEAHYEVAETFFQGNRLNLAIGRTKGIAGDVMVDFSNPANSQIGTIVIDVSQLKSDEDRRDNFIRRNGLQSSQYPQVTFKPTKIEGIPASVKPGDQLTLKVTGDLTVKQTTKPATFDVTLTTGQDKLTGTGSTLITLSDFGAGPIQIAMLQTEDKAKLVFDFVAVPAQ